MPDDRRTTSAPRAFTLIELILVLAILAIVAGAVAPSFHGFGVGRARANYADTLVALAGYARAQAVGEGREYRLNADVAARAVWLTADANDGTFAPAAGDYGERFAAPANVTLSADLPQRDDGGQYVRFLPTGRTEAATFRVGDSLGGETVVACASPTETFRVLKPGEAVP